MTKKLTVFPCLNINDNDGLNKWRLKDLPAYLELKSDNHTIPTGWVLIKGYLLRRGVDCTSYFIIETESSTIKVPLPTTRKGYFSEIVFLPPDMVTLKLEPMQSAGEFELVDLSLKSVGWWEKNISMLKRVFGFCKKNSFSFCYKVGLRVHHLVFNLHEAYAIVSKFKHYAPGPEYQNWLIDFDELSDKDRLLIKKQINTWADKPGFEILITVNEYDKELLQRTLSSLDKQLYRHFFVSLLIQDDDGGGVNEADLPEWAEVLPHNDLSLKFHHNTEKSWCMLLEPGVVLSVHALYWYASAILNEPDTRLIYSDHDYINQDSLRSNPVFKPDWSAELLRSTNYIGSSVSVMRTDTMLSIMNAMTFDWQDIDHHDVLLRASELIEHKAISHIPALLAHLPDDPAISWKLNSNGDSSPVAAHLIRLGIPAQVEAGPEGRYKVTYQMPEHRPLISLIIPTRNALNLIEPCVESIVKLTTYQDYEIIIVDNQSDDQATLDYFDSLKQNSIVRILKYDQPFNYSAINNFAVSECSGEVICLLNNDTEVITPGWLEEMLSHLMQQDVGIVGAKLFYSDGLVQHAGDAVGPGGCASHLHSMIGRNSPGYCSRAVLVQEVSAVTAACLMTWRKLYQQVEGLDEINLAIAFNDVDYCLKVRAAGYRIIWTPYAELYHYESVSRGQDDTREKVKRSRNEANYMRKRWKHLMDHDPYYNPNLSYQRADFSLSHAPLVAKPWRRYVWGLFRNYCI